MKILCFDVENNFSNKYRSVSDEYKDFQNVQKSHFIPHHPLYLNYNLQYDIVYLYLDYLVYTQ